MGGDVIVFLVGDFFIVNVLYDIFGGGNSDGILMKINSDCLVEYVIYLGMENFDFIESIDFDVAGNIYVVSNNNLFNIVVSKIFNDG